MEGKIRGLAGRRRSAGAWSAAAGGLLAGLIFLAGAAGTLLLTGAVGTDDASAYGKHNAGAKVWMFAEGYTGPGFDEWILVYNPPVPMGSGSDIKVRLTLSGSSDTVAYYDSPIIGTSERWSVRVNDICASHGYSGDVSITAASILDPDRAPFICERAMYFTYQTPEGPVTGGSQVLGYQEGLSE